MRISDWSSDVCSSDLLTSGVAGLSASGTGRGGARNRADRESHALTAAQIGNLKAAERHAEKIGLPFTRMISIHWQAAGVPLAVMAKATGRFTDLMARSEEHTSELQSLMRISHAVFCLK